MGLKLILTSQFTRNGLVLKLGNPCLIMRQCLALAQIGYMHMAGLWSPVHGGAVRGSVFSPGSPLSSITLKHIRPTSAPSRTSRLMYKSV